MKGIASRPGGCHSSSVVGIWSVGSNTSDYLGKPNPKAQLGPEALKYESLEP